MAEQGLKPPSSVSSLETLLTAVALGSFVFAKGIQLKGQAERGVLLALRTWCFTMERLGNAGEIHKTPSGYSGDLRLPHEGIYWVQGSCRVMHRPVAGASLRYAEHRLFKLRELKTVHQLTCIWPRHLLREVKDLKVLVELTMGFSLSHVLNGAF